MIAKLHVGIICGGQSSEHEISLLSAFSILSHLDTEQYDLTLIGIDRQGRWNLCDREQFLAQQPEASSIALSEKRIPLMLIPNDPWPLRQYENHQPIALDVIFPIVHGTLGEDGNLQGLLRCLNLPFVGSAVLSSAICMDKALCKRLLRDANIAIAPFISLMREESIDDLETQISPLGWPLYVKPANQGSSVGVSRVEHLADLPAALDLAWQYDHKLLIEQGINGREIECAVLGNQNPQASLCGEIKVIDQYYSYESKYLESASAQLSVPANLTPEQTQKIQRIALKTYALLECKGLARIDVFLTADDQVIVNEINTLPGFTAISMYPQLWQASGLDYSDLLSELIALAQREYARTQQLSIEQVPRKTQLKSL